MLNIYSFNNYVLISCSIYQALLMLNYYILNKYYLLLFTITCLLSFSIIYIDKKKIHLTIIYSNILFSIYLEFYMVSHFG